MINKPILTTPSFSIVLKFSVALKLSDLPPIFNLDPNPTSTFVPVPSKFVENVG